MLILIYSNFFLLVCTRIHILTLTLVDQWQCVVLSIFDGILVVVLHTTHDWGKVNPTCKKILECYFSATLAYKTKHSFRLTLDCIKISHQMMEDIMVGVSVTVTTTKSMCNSLYTMKLIRSSQSKFWKWILKSPYVVLEFDAL